MTDQANIAISENDSDRKYHDDEKPTYIMPNNRHEDSRLHQQHRFLKYALQRDHLAPVTGLLNDGVTVLDSGCGPASWTLEMAEKYPNSKFHGVDIAGAFPETLPANLELITGNIAKHIPFRDNTFDYVHQRLLIGGFTEENWESNLKELYRVLKPGGYVELAEMDVQNVVNMGPLFTRLQISAMQLFTARGLPSNVCSKLEGRLVQNGFVDQKVEVTPLAMNHSGKAGEMFWADYSHAALTTQPYVGKFNPEWADAKVHKEFIEALGEECPVYKTDINWYGLYAQKPRE